MLEVLARGLIADVRAVSKGEHVRELELIADEDRGWELLGLFDGETGGRHSSSFAPRAIGLTVAL